MKLLLYRFSTLLILTIIVCFNGSFAQSNMTCGTFKSVPPSGSNPDSLVYDRFGNTFDLSNLLVSGSNNLFPSPQNSGYFSVFKYGIEPMNADNVINEVLTYISQVIPQQTQSICGQNIVLFNVNLEIIWLDFANPDPALVLQFGLYQLPEADDFGSATPFYSFDIQDNQCAEIVLERPYIKIHGGIPAQNITQIDGRIIMNSNLPNAMTWNVDATSINFPGQVDLYTEFLHQVMHVIGFSSHINPVFPDFYTLWDQSLRVVDDYIPNGTGNNPQDILAGTDNCISNCWDLHSNFITIATNSCSSLTISPDIVVGDANIAPLYGNPTVDPFNSAAFSNMLSHLSAGCSGQNINYVVRPDRGPNEFQREITTPELSVFCEMGYGVTTPAYSCTGIYNISHVDAVYTEEFGCCYQSFNICVGETLTILPSDLLCNDVTNGAIHEITRIWTTETNTQVQANTNGTWEITVTDPYLRYFRVYYTVTGEDCRQHNNSFIIIAEVCEECVPPNSCENLLCENDFDNFAYTDWVVATFGGPYIVAGMQGSATPDIYADNSGNHYLYIDNSSNNQELVSLPLSECIEPGCSMKINLALSYKSLYSQPGHLEIWGSNTLPCRADNQIVVPISDDFGISTACSINNSFNPASVASIIPTSFSSNTFNPNFAPITEILWENTSMTDEICYLTFIGDEQDEDGQFFIDDIVVQKICIDAQFTTQNSCPLIEFIPIDLPGNTSHLWDFGDNTITSNLENPVHSYTTSGTFTVTHTVTDLCGNSESSTQSVVIDIPVAAFTFALTTCPSYQFTNTSDGSNLQFAWDFGNGNTSADENPTFAFAANGSYTVTLTMSNDCGSSTATQTVLVDCIEEACSCPVGLTIYMVGTPGNPTEDINVTTSVLPALVVTNSCIRIYSNLVINQNYEISDCHLIMHPGSSITINTDIRLKSIGNEYAGCEVMWKGIIMEPSANLRFESNIIQDAQYAISVNNKAVVRLVNNTFRKNYIGVYDPVTGCPWFDLTRFSGNNFNCTDVTLLPPFSGQTPLPGDISYAGVSLNNLNMVDFGNVAFPLFNTFNDISNGFVAENASFGVSQARFNRIQPNSDYAISGYGIHAVGTSDNTLIQRGEDIISGTASFSRVWNPIYTEGMGCDIMNNHITKSFNGVDVRLTAECNLMFR